MMAKKSHLPQRVYEYAASVLGQSLKDVIRLLRLHLFIQVLRGRNKKEGKKIALHSSHRTATLSVILHLLPITTCIGLVVLNMKSLYIGTISTASLTALQFAAKLLEVMIQVSITTVMLALVRTQILGESPFPFGGLIAIFRITDLSLLWSLDLWGFLTSSVTGKWARAIMSLLIPIAVVLAAVVGPSSAVLMIPRPISHLARNDWFVMGAVDVVDPAKIVLNNTELFRESEFNLSSHEFMTAYDLSGVMSIVDSYGSRDMQSTYFENEGGITAATIPSIISAYLLNRETGEADIAVVNTAQPYVYMDCWTPSTSEDWALMDDEYISFGPEKRYLDESTSLEWLLPNCSAVSEDDSFAIIPTLQMSDDTLLTGVLSQPPETGSNTSILMTWAYVQPGSNSTEPVLGAIYACTIEANWAMESNSMQLQGTSGRGVSSNNDNNPYLLPANLKEKRLISLSPAWTRRVIALAKQDLDVFIQQFTSPLISLGLSYVPPLYAAGIGSFSPDSDGDADVTDQQYKDLIQFLEKDHSPKDCTWLYRLAGDWDWSATLSLVEVHAFDNGYGYDTSTTTVRLSLAVIIFYLTTVTAYLIYSITTGLVSSSWDSVAELVTLALNSEKPQPLHNTSVGINTLETFRQPVNIRVGTDRSLELVFEAGNKGGRYHIIEENKAY